MMRRLFALCLVAAGMASPAAAQRNRGLRPLPPGERPAMPANATPQEKQKFLQQQVRRTFWKVAKNRLGFTDEQMTKLEQSSQRFDQRRRLIGQDEKAARVALRTEILADSTANQANIAAALDRLQTVQRQRLELQVDEQKELAAFMTPLQRAKYMTLQDQVRKRLQQIVGQRPDSAQARQGPPFP